MNDRVFHNVEQIKLCLDNESKCLVGGCFDLIHVGHLHLLRYAASLCDILIVAVLSDDYIRSYKHRRGPVIEQNQRVELVASIRYVNFAFISNESPSNHNILSLLQPNYVVFGEEAGRSERIKKRIEQIKFSSPQTEVKILPRYAQSEISTGLIVKKIQGFNLL